MMMMDDGDNGDDGDDILQGHEGNDTLDGGRGDDVLTASNVASSFNRFEFHEVYNNGWRDYTDKGWLSEDNYNVLYGGIGFGDCNGFAGSGD